MDTRPPPEVVSSDLCSPQLTVTSEIKLHVKRHDISDKTRSGFGNIVSS